MNRPLCPYLGTLDKDDRPGPAVDYPSLENQCFAVPADELLLLADQATFCLSGECRHCPRYQNAQHATGLDEPDSASGASTGRGAIPHEHNQPANLEPDLMAAPAAATPFAGWVDALAAPDGDGAQRRWIWAGVALIFVTLFLCGGALAAYTGWQFVSARYLVAATGEISTLTESARALSAPSPTAAPQYLVVTATSAGVATQPAPAASPQTNFPLAVTPTPIVVNPAQLPQSPAGTGAVITSNSVTAAPNANQSELANLPQDITLPTPEVNLQLEVPTRRPTPVFEVPTSTPEVVEAAPPTPSPTPSPVLGPPVVVFEPFQYALPDGQCTMVRWHVENVQAVFYENQGVNGDGQREECMDDEPRTYTLAVVLPDGSTSIYTTTIDYLPPTPTMTPTPSFTPERDIEPTPTWTPNQPTPTPTPPAFFGIGLSIFGEDHHECSAGSTCEFDILVKNDSNVPDTSSLTIVQSGPWPALLCADNGGCASGALTLSNLNVGESRLVKLKVNVASDAAAETAGYGLQAISNGSGGSVTSSVVTVKVEVP